MKNMVEVKRDNGKPLHIYVAGPYTPAGTDMHDAARLAEKNVTAAVRAGIEVIKRGHYPYIPHLSHFIHLRMSDDESQGNTYWYPFTMAWLSRCDALLYIAPSKGADAELKWAKENGLKVFLRVEDIPSVPIVNDGLKS